MSQNYLLLFSRWIYSDLESFNQISLHLLSQEAGWLLSSKTLVSSMDRYSMSVQQNTHHSVSRMRRLYLHPPNATGPTASDRLTLLPIGIVVEPYPLRILAADCLFCCCLGFNHAISIGFFLLSSPSRLYIFHYYVVAPIALRFSSNSIGYFTN